MHQLAISRARGADLPRPARPGGAPRRAAALRPRCAAPSQTPKAGVSPVPPSLQSIQDNGGEGYVSPLISLDWGEQALAETPASVADAALMGERPLNRDRAGPHGVRRATRGSKIFHRAGRRGALFAWSPVPRFCQAPVNNARDTAGRGSTPPSPPKNKPARQSPRLTCVAWASA
jgi:hypothetical protein